MKEYKVITEKNTEKWYLNNQLVKEIKYYDNGNKEFEEYFLNGKRHRENDLPDYQSWYYNGDKCCVIYHINGKEHRENGLPAFQSWYENGNKKYEEYYINGKECKKEDTFLNNNQSKTINIKGKEISEDTIILALKNYQETPKKSKNLLNWLKRK